MDKKERRLPVELLPHILSYLPWRNVVRCRSVSSEWKASSARCPCTDVLVETVDDLVQLSKALPGIWSLTITIGEELRDENLVPLRSMHQLRRLLVCNTGLLSRAFEESMWPCLQRLDELDLSGNTNLQWSLRDVALAFPQLRILRTTHNYQLTGDLCDLTSTIPGATPPLFTVLEFSWCRNVTGNLLDLAHFPHLEELSLNRTQVQGDIRDVTACMFPSLQEVALGDTAVYGAGATLQRVDHAFAVMLGRYHLTRHSRAECAMVPFVLQLDTESEDYYMGRPQQQLYSSEHDPPFWLEPVRIVMRRGYRWSNQLGGACDIVWFDPEPESSSEEEYSLYRRELEKDMAESSPLFRGLVEPPLLDDYIEISRRHGVLR